LRINPDPFRPLTENSEIILIGSFDAEQEFFKRYGVGSE
jgi:hypothetical protein